MPENVKAARPTGRRRRVKTFSDERKCAEPECDTRISIYNPAEHCYAHSPRRFTRTRGVALES